MENMLKLKINMNKEYITLKKGLILRLSKIILKDKIKEESKNEIEMLKNKKK
jgi:hypothetical protein